MKSQKETIQVMHSLSGLRLKFGVVGPFLVADIGDIPLELLRGIPVGEHGMEQLIGTQKTESHIHEFPSFYKSEGLDVECEGKRFKLPEHALTLVFPGIDHSWVVKQEVGAVGSLDSRHEKQVIEAVA